jgi:hypothetical protein
MRAPGGRESGPESALLSRAYTLLTPIYVMIARDVVYRNPPPAADSPSPAGGPRLTTEERRAIEEAAEAEGYSESFTSLLCRFAELIGTDEVLRELERIEADPKE